MQDRQDELKSFKEIPVPVGQSAKSLPNRERIKIYEERGTGRVVNDPRLEINWKPIDKVAARVVAEAPWWAQPPQPEPKFMSKEEINREPIDVPRVKMKRMLTERGYTEDMVDLESVAGPALENHERNFKKDLKVNDELIGRSKDVIAAIDYLTAEMRGPWAEHQEFIKKALGEVREQRIALGSETRLLLAALRDIRTFFLEKDYDTEINRLREFIDVCERLRALKDAGTLDAIADTILKL
jgi:hypothetical protein